MFKLNNKGFAFSTILYGLLLMGLMVILLIMSTMQTNRSTNKFFIEKIEDELNRYSLTETQFSSSNYTEDGQEYVVPMGQAGWYKIELWGAQGGGNNGGLGAYTSGMIWLDENAHLYFYIGKSDSTYGSSYTFNGGGFASNTTSRRGGGATDVRLVSGAWDNEESLKSRIMVAAGGGGRVNKDAGVGGSILGGNGNASTNNGAASFGDSAKFGKGEGTTGANLAGGGGGYYGGSASTTSVGAGGGSSYIAGYAGVVNVNTNKTYDTGYSSSATNGYFVGGLMIAGVNSGSGSAKISKVSTGDINNPPVPLNNIVRDNNGAGFRYVRDCVSGSRIANASTIKNNVWSEISVIRNGENIAAGKPMRIENTGTDYTSSIGDGKISYGGAKATGANTTQCMVVDLGSVQHTYSEIAVWHDFDTANTNVRNHTVSISLDGSNWTEVTSNGNTHSLESMETPNGLHYSAWYVDSTLKSYSGERLPEGTYYIALASADNLFLTNNSSNKVESKLFSGNPKQKFLFKKIDNDYYRIISVYDNKSVQILDGTEYNDRDVGVADYVDGEAWEKWKVVPAGNGTVYIVSGHNTYMGFTTTGGEYNKSSTLKSKSFINSSSSSNTSARNRQLRFRLYSVDY